MAAAATGEALKSSGSSYFGRPTGAAVTVQQDVVMERSFGDSAAAKEQPSKPMGQSLLMAAAAQGVTQKSLVGPPSNRFPGATAAATAAKAAPEVQQATATAAKTVTAATTGSGRATLAVAAAAGTANLGGTTRSEQAEQAEQAAADKGSRVLEVERATKPAAATAANSATALPLAERVQRIEEKNPRAVSAQIQASNTTTTVPEKKYDGRVSRGIRTQHSRKGNGRGSRGR